MCSAAACSLGNEHATVVGVMREGFAFPVSHDVWMPLRADDAESGAAFGSRHHGLRRARARRDPRDGAGGADHARPHVRRSSSRATHEHLQPRVQSYAKLFFSAPVGRRVRRVLLDLRVRAAAARARLRQRRAAAVRPGRDARERARRAHARLGRVAAGSSCRCSPRRSCSEASRRWSASSAADVALRTWGLEFLEINLGRLPFWFDLRVSPATVLSRRSALTVLGSAIAGVMPALKVTRGMGDRA